MKKLLCSLFSCALLFNFSCSNMNNNTNPLLSPFTAPHGAAPFDRIKTDDFEPAITKAIELHESEIDAIARQTDAPTYENTIEAMELSGSTLSRITSIFFNLLSANGDDEMIAVSERVSPMLTEHSNNINLNEALFKRVKAVYEQRDSLSLSAEEMRLLTETYNGMARSGANLEGEARDRYREVSRELSQLSLQFESNLRLSWLNSRLTSNLRLSWLNSRLTKPQIRIEPAESDQCLRNDSYLSRRSEGIAPKRTRRRRNESPGKGARKCLPLRPLLSQFVRIPEIGRTP